MADDGAARCGRHWTLGVRSVKAKSVWNELTTLTTFTAVKLFTLEIF